MQNVIERMREENRARRIRACFAFIGNAIMIAGVILFMWAAMWAACALSDVCYAANI